MSLKWIVYNLLFAAVYPFLLPGFLLRMFRRGGYAARMGDRFAVYPEAVKKAFSEGEIFDRHAVEGKLSNSSSRPVWIHAVSVGEVQVAGQLMREWRKVEPDVRFVFSTTSSTGWKIAEKECKEVLIYNPLDFPNFVKSALLTFRPRAIVLTESEIWPNFILQAKKYSLPLFLINARVSDRSAPRYRKAKFFFGDVFGAFTKIFAQSELDAERIRATMKPQVDNVVVTGSFKFDVAKRNSAKEAELRKWLGLGEESAARRVKILLGGSTWPGEDKLLIEIYKKLLQVSAAAVQPLLVIAPRHFEKADDIEENIRKAGFDCVRRSKMNQAAAPQLPSGKPAVYLADTTGELMGLYALADYVFVGKSLCAHGSQNMIEPCLCGKPTFVGPFTENFRPVMSDLLSCEALVQVKNAAELEAKICLYFGNEALSAALGEKARAAVLRRQGGVPKCVEAIREALG